MKSLILFILGVFIGFVLLSNEQIITSSITSKHRDYSRPNKKEKTNYDPGKDNQFSKKERDYFNKIAKSSEYNGECEISRWKSDMKIYVKGERPDYLMNELNRVVNELNEIINPIEIVIVEKQEDANYLIYFCHADEYEKHEPAVKPYIQSNWGMFCVDGGEVIKSGSMYVDIERCKGIKAQKHLLREELTQSLGLKNDSYSHPESIFYQVWSETTEYAPIDRALIDMLYNHW